jgi:RHS repeat-associated protein
VSRKTHGAAGTFDLPLSLNPANPTVEPRQGTSATVVLSFDKPVTGAVAAVTEGVGTAGTPTFSGNDVIVNLTGVGNAQWVTVTLTDVASADGGAGGSGAVRVGFLLGDVNQNRVVTVSDLAQVNAQIAQPVTGSSFLRDVNANGSLTVADKGIANTQITRALAVFANRAPVVDAGADQAITLPAKAALDGSASDDGLPSPPSALTLAWSKVSGPGTVTFDSPSTAATAAGFSDPGTYVLRLTARDASLVSDDTVQVVVEGAALPPDPATVAPPLDPTVATSTYAATQFLYTGANPIQTGVAPGTIAPKRVAVLRGKAQDRSGTALTGVRISVLAHPEFGQTLSRTDGMFDLAVNGGGYLVINYEKSGYLPAQRRVDVPWQDYVVVDAVAMIPRDPTVTLIDLTSSEPMQVARGSVVTDESGSRQVTILFPRGLSAQAYRPDGTTHALTSMRVRATEYTVGPNGPNAMPAELPPTTAYTYAVELSVDEAPVKKSGKDVLFDRPVPIYLDNFLSHAVGTPIPIGYYDRDLGAWVASEDGRVVGVVDIIGGVAQLDTNGDGVPDDAAGLGISEDELRQLARLYQPGTTLWRWATSHFSTFDANHPPMPPDGAIRADVEAPKRRYPDCVRIKTNSIVECETQVLREQLPITGANLTLNYTSNRVLGRSIHNHVQIPLSSTVLPSSLKRILLQVRVAGRVQEESFAPAPDLKHSFQWDGADAYGREVQGGQRALVRIGYVYDAVYWGTASAARRRFGAYTIRAGGSALGAARFEVVLWRDFETTLGAVDARAVGLGGWTPSVHHTYDAIERVLYRGDGSRQAATSFPPIVKTVAGKGVCLGGGASDGVPATESAIPGCPLQLAFASDGSYSISPGRPDVGSVQRVDAGGIITSLAIHDMHIASTPDGTLFSSSSGSGEIYRMDPGGTRTLVAGGGSTNMCAVGQIAALEARLSNVDALATLPDGSLVFHEDGAPCSYASSIVRLGSDGYLTRVVWARARGIAASQDGTLYWTNQYAGTVYRLRPGGDVEHIGGQGGNGFGGDGGPAVDALFNWPTGIALGPDGQVYVADSNNFRVRRIDNSGTVTTVAGSGQGPVYAPAWGNHGPATQAPIAPIGIAVRPDGIYFADNGSSVVRRISPPVPGFSGEDFAIASKDGRELYQFDPQGKHLRTIDTLTAATLWEFGYDGSGRLATVSDGDGNVTSFEHDATGMPTAIVAPFGQRTALAVDANGYLSTVVSPIGSQYSMLYGLRGLLSQFRDPNGNVANASYDLLGQLLVDTNAAGGSLRLSRTELGTKGNYEVSVTSSLGRNDVFRVEYLTSGEERRTAVDPATHSTISLKRGNGQTTTTQPDGTVISLTEGPEPRFGMQAGLPKEFRVATMDGRVYTETSTRTTLLADAANLLSVTRSTDVAQVNGRSYTSTFDAALRKFTNTSPTGRQRLATIDVQGRLLGDEVAGIEALAYNYDPRGRLSTVTQGSGSDQRMTTMGYNPQGYLANITDPLGRVASFQYDLSGRVTRQTFPDGREVQFAYDSNGNVTSITPPGRPAHTFAYTPVDLEQTYAPPPVAGAGALSTHYTYNLDKQLTRVTRPDGLAVDLTYDAAGRIATQVTPAGTTTYAYAAATGKLAGIAAPGGVGLAYTYDGFLPLTETWTGPVAGTVARSYDNDFRPTAVSLNGQPIAFGYDTDSLLAQAGELAIARRADNGLISGTTLGQVTTTQGYNGFGELASTEARYAGSSLYSVTHARDKLGRIVQKVETIEGVTTTYAYTYDLAGRLAGVTEDGVPAGTYVYDPNGNRIEADGRTASYDDQDRLLAFDGATYGYTANGELATRTEGSQVTAYDYDTLGNLRGVTQPDGKSISYVIDGRNRRIGKKVNGALVQGFLYQDGLKPIAELGGAGTVVARFVYGTRPNVPEYMIRGGVKYRFILDHLGSPRLVVDATTGAIAQRMDYAAWGVVTLDTNPGFQPFGFAGGLYDSDTALVRFGARDYDARAGRWTAKDPIGFGGHAANFYAYVGGVPTSSQDPLGLASDSPYEIVTRHPSAVAEGMRDSALWAWWERNAQGWLEYTNKRNAALRAAGQRKTIICDPNSAWYLEHRRQRELAMQSALPLFALYYAGYILPSDLFGGVAPRSREYDPVPGPGNPRPLPNPYSGIPQPDDDSDYLAR